MSSSTLTQSAVLVIATLLAFAAAGCRPLEPTPPEPNRPQAALRSAPMFQALKGTDGAIQEAIIHVEKLPALAKQLEIRTVTVRPHRNAVLTADNEVALELRSGDRPLGRLWT